jgi:hypothetical protein
VQEFIVSIDRQVEYNSFKRKPRKKLKKIFSKLHFSGKENQGFGNSSDGQKIKQMSSCEQQTSRRTINVRYPVLRIRDVYPGSRILIFTHPGSRIPDPKTATKERGEKKLVVIPFYVATNVTKL